MRSRFSAGHFQHLISVTKRHPLHPSMPANAIIVITTFIVYIFIIINYSQSVTSRLETSRYQDFSQSFESIGLGLENFGLEKKSRYWSRKYLVSKKGLGIDLKNFGLEKKSRYRSQNFWSQKSLSNDLKNLVSKKSQ